MFLINDTRKIVQNAVDNTSSYKASLYSPVSAIWLSASACLCLEVIPIVPDVIIQITTINTNTIITSLASPKTAYSVSQIVKNQEKAKRDNWRQT